MLNSQDPLRSFNCNDAVFLYPCIEYLCCVMKGVTQGAQHLRPNKLYIFLISLINLACLLVSKLMPWNLSKYISLNRITWTAIGKIGGWVGSGMNNLFAYQYIWTDLLLVSLLYPILAKSYQYPTALSIKFMYEKLIYIPRHLKQTWHLLVSPYFLHMSKLLSKSGQRQYYKGI